MKVQKAFKFRLESTAVKRFGIYDQVKDNQAFNSLKAHIIEKEKTLDPNIEKARLIKPLIVTLFPELR